MDPRQHRFLIATLGSDGAAALLKAAERSRPLGNAIIPRAILAWLGLAARFEHDGELPGNPGTHVIFRKSESGFSGTIRVNDETYTFQDANLYRVAAGIGVALGADSSPLSEELRDLDLVKLGRTLDALVVTGELRKTQLPKTGLRLDRAGILTDSKILATANRATRKAELPGQTAKPIQQQGPIAAEVPKKQPKQVQSNLPKKAGAVKLPKTPSLKVGKSEARRLCEFCDRPQFKADKFIGCACLQDLAKSINTTAFGDGYVLEFKGREWDEDSVRLLIQTLRGESSGT